MHKLTLGALILLCLWEATSWQRQPQWRVVVEQHMTHVNTIFKNNLVFTPSKTGLYRMSAYCSVDGTQGSQWNFEFSWTDFAGQLDTKTVSCGSLEDGQGTFVFVFSPIVGTPVYLSSNSQNGEPTYNGAFTIEQLQ